METKNTTDLDICVVSDLKEYGRTEDGEMFIGEQFFIQAEDKHGNRWRWWQARDGVRVEEDVDGISFHDVRLDATVRLDNYIARFKELGRIKMNYWDSVSPAYGSDAWIEYGEADARANERS
jgi:hypothetical protein